MLLPKYEPATEILYLAAGITLAVAFFVLIFSATSPLGITALQA